MAARVDVVVIGEGAPAQVFRGLDGACVRIGRNPDNEVVLRDPALSRVHLEVSFDGARFLVRDRSSNGSFVRGQRLPPESVYVPGTEIVAEGYRVWAYPAGGGHRLDEEATPHQGSPPTPTAKNVAPARATAPRVRAPSETPTQAAPPPAAPPPDASHPAIEDDALIALRKRLHAALLEQLDLRKVNLRELGGEEVRQRVGAGFERLIRGTELPPGIDPAVLLRELVHEALGLGPLEELLADPTVSEIMVVDRDHVYVERKGRIERVPQRFLSDEALLAVIERIVTPIGRRVDESTPLVDARLPDGSRVNAMIPPLAVKGPTLTIRRFVQRPTTFDDLLRGGSLDARMARFLERCVQARKNLVISGGTGSGKTTLLNVLARAIGATERIVTIEDVAELDLPQEHVVSAETKPANLEQKGEYTIRDLLRNALRMRPDRILVGECRGGEALDMLQAMATGHDGSLTTLHASDPMQAIHRLETMVLLGGVDLPVRAVREQIAQAIHVVVQTARSPDGARRVTHVSEVLGLSDHGEVVVRDIFVWSRLGADAAGRATGRFRHTGYVPTFLGEFIQCGLVLDGRYL